MTQARSDTARVADAVARVLSAPVRILLDGGVVESAGGRPAGWLVPVASFAWVHQGRQYTVEVGEGSGTLTTDTLEAIADLLVHTSSGVQDADLMRDRFVHDLLTGAAGEVSDGRRIAQILGLDLERPRSVILVEAAGYIAAEPVTDSLTRRPRAAQRVIDTIVRFFRLRNEAICAHIGEGQIAVLKASASRDLPDWTLTVDPEDDGGWANLDALKRAGRAMHAELLREFHSPIDIAVGRYHPGIQGLAASYEDCRIALRLGRVRNPGSVHCLPDLGLAALVAADPTPLQRSLATRLIAPLECDPELQHTLRVFFDEDCSVIQASARLAVHRNTLMYRLDRIARISGLNPRKFNDAVQLKTALELGMDFSVQEHNAGRKTA